MKSVKNVTKKSKMLTAKQYRAVMKEIRKMWGSSPDNLTKAKAKIFNKLVDQAEAYEKEHFKF